MSGYGSIWLLDDADDVYRSLLPLVVFPDELLGPISTPRHRLTGMVRVRPLFAGVVGSGHLMGGETDVYPLDILPAPVPFPEPPPPPPPELTDEDDMLDFGDIGGIYNDSTKAVANTAAFNAYVSSRASTGLPVAIRFTGPVNVAYANKREPSDVYFDMNSGPLTLNVGGSGKISALFLHGVNSTLRGLNPTVGITPLFKITRTAGQYPSIMLRDVRIVSAGSGIQFVTPGALTRCENCHVEYTGTGAIDFDGWTDLDTASFALKVEDADGMFVDGFGCSLGGGHGVIVKRWHAGRYSGRVRVCNGSGFKGQQLAELRGDTIWCESNKGYGLHVRDSGSERYEAGGHVFSGSANNTWRSWFEGNNGRSTPYISSGYSFSQFKFENCARVELSGHSGWRNNMARLDTMSRFRNMLVEQQRTDLVTCSDSPPDLQLVTNGTVTGAIDLPVTGSSSAAVTNWHTVWTNPAFRPTAAIFGTPSVNERIRVTWPAGSFNNTSVLTTAYWNPWGLSTPLTSPGAFYYEAEIQSVDSNIPNYCIAREAASNRQTPIVGIFLIQNTGSAITAFTLWDTHRRRLGGEVQVNATLSNMTPGFNAFTSGMQDQQGNAAQTTVHTMDIWQWRFWKL